MSVYLHMDDPTVSYDLTENKEVEGEKDIITEYNTLYCEHEKGPDKPSHEKGAPDLFENITFISTIARTTT